MTPAPVSLAAPRGDGPGPRGTLALDRFDLGVLVALFAFAVAPLAAMLVRVQVEGGLFTGGDGYLVADPLQYVNWVRQAGEHWAAANLYDLRPGPRSFLHPGVLISGLAYRAGVSAVVAYLLFKPVAVAVLFVGSLLYVRRFLARRGDRRLGLVVALFAVSPVAALIAWSGVGGTGLKFDFDVLANEMWTGHWLWGYLYTAVAVGLMPLTLLAYERARGRDARARRRPLVAAAAAGLACAWLQPWQGATLALTVAGGEVLTPRGDRGSWRHRCVTAAPVLAAIAAPLVYYYVLSRLDPSWALAGRVNRFGRWPWWVGAIGLAPLALPALAAYRRRPPDFGATALRVWPLASVIVFYQPAGTFPFHAFQGLGLPLAVLALVGVRDLLGERPLPVVAAAAAAAAMIVPGLYYRANELRLAVQSGRQAHFLTASEHDALRYLDRLPEPGGVLAPAYIGVVVPAYTGRETWVGAGSWTPDAEARTRQADALFAGRLGPAQAERLARRSGARFLLSDCHARADIHRIVAGFAARARRFGCATVYRVRR